MKNEKGVWNVSLLPDDMRQGIQSILQRDFDICWDEEDYPVVLNKAGDLAFKEDTFVMNLMVQGHLRIDFTALALDPDPARQRFRRQLCKRMGYTLQDYAVVCGQNRKTTIH